MRTTRFSRLWALASLSLWIPMSCPDALAAATSGSGVPPSAGKSVLSRATDGTPRLLLGALSLSLIHISPRSSRW